MLLDSAKLQEEEASFANAKGYSKHHPALPLHTVADSQRVLPLQRPMASDEPAAVTEQATGSFRGAGHILGATIVEMSVKGLEQTKGLVFFGVLSRYDNLVIFDPALEAEANVLLVELTYSDREIRFQDPEAELVQTLRTERSCDVTVPDYLDSAALLAKPAHAPRLPHAP